MVGVAQASFPRSPKLPLLEPSLAVLAADYASTSSVCAETAAAGLSCPSFATPRLRHVLWSAAEAIAVPRIEQPNEKGGAGIFVERTLLDALLPFNATLSLVSMSEARA